MAAESLTASYRRYLTAVTAYHFTVARVLELGASDYLALNLLELTGGMTAGRLAERTGLTHSATTRMVDRLEAAGYVRRATDPADRRRSRIELGDTSPPRLADTVQSVRAHVAPAFADLSDAQLSTLHDYFIAAAAGFEGATSALTDAM